MACSYLKQLHHSTLVFEVAKEQLGQMVSYRRRRVLFEEDRKHDLLECNKGMSADGPRDGKAVRRGRTGAPRTTWRSVERASGSQQQDALDRMRRCSLKA